MLKPVSNETMIINDQLERCYVLKSLIPEMEKSGLIDFNIVKDDVNGKAYRCWYGKYQDIEASAPSFSYEQIAEHLGCTTKDAQIMFGAAGSATLHERERHLDAHIFWLEKRLAA